MSIEPGTEPRRIWWRLALLVLVVLPFLPDLAIYAVGGLAKVNGCVADQKEICRIAGIDVSVALSVLITTAVVIGSAFVGFGLAALWLIMCYLLILRGWAGLAARSVLALSVTIIFALLPYIAPAIAVAPLANTKCQPNEGGGSCLIFGGDVSSAHHTVALPWLILPGVPIAVGTAIVYAIVAAIIKARRTRASRQPAQSS